MIKSIDSTCSTCYNIINRKGDETMTFRELDKMLKADGWMVVSSKGSHIHYKHPQKQGKVTVPNHASDIKIGTLKSILKQAGLK